MPSTYGWVWTVAQAVTTCLSKIGTVLTKGWEASWLLRVVSFGLWLPLSWGLLASAKNAIMGKIGEIATESGFNPTIGKDLSGLWGGFSDGFRWVNYWFPLDAMLTAAVAMLTFYCWTMFWCFLILWIKKQARMVAMFMKVIPRGL